MCQAVLLFIGTAKQNVKRGILKDIAVAKGIVNGTGLIAKGLQVFTMTIIIPN